MQLLLLGSRNHNLRSPLLGLIILCTVFVTAASMLIAEPLKGQCHKILNTFLSENSSWAPGMVSWNFSFSPWYSQKTCARVVIGFARHDARVVIDFAWHSVHFVVDYADTCFSIVNKDMTMTTRTLMENVEGFSQILKEQSGEKSTWVCLYTQ